MMKANDALKANRSVFENELDDLISGAVHPDSFLSLDQHVLQEPPSKRLKTEDGAKDIRYPKEDGGLEHKPSRILRDRTNIPSPQRAPPGKDLTQLSELPAQKFSPKSSRWDKTSSRSSSSHSTNSRRASGESSRYQGNSTRDDLSYEQLLDQQRREKLQGVDRYVPAYRSPRETASPALLNSKTDFFPLPRLPEAITRKVLEFALVKPDHITIDASSHRSLVKEYTKIPLAMDKLQHNGSFYLLPVPWDELKRQIERMREDTQHTGLKLKDRDTKNKQRSSHTAHYGLATALLRVSRSIGLMAADILYSQNVFTFPSAITAWMQLDTFLQSIGPRNVARLQNIHIHVPLWHRGIHEDYIESSILDLLSPTSHLQLPPRDRLLSSIQRATTTLISNSNLTLSLTLENSIAADYWTGRYVNNKRLLSLADAEEHVGRKRKGVACLKEWSELIFKQKDGRKRPILTIQPVLQCVQADKKEFRSRFAGLVEEAARYGWVVEGSLGARKG